MKRPRTYATLSNAVAWIAANDGFGDDENLDLPHVSQMVTVALVADLFGKTTKQIAEAVIKIRANK